jgi:hypothetical protein
MVFPPVLYGLSPSVVWSFPIRGTFLLVYPVLYGLSPSALWSCPIRGTLLLVYPVLYGLSPNALWSCPIRGTLLLVYPVLYGLPPVPYGLSLLTLGNKRLCSIHGPKTIGNISWEVPGPYIHWNFPIIPRCLGSLNATRNGYK